MKGWLAKLNSARTIYSATQGLMEWHGRRDLIATVRKQGQRRTQLAFCIPLITLPFVAVIGKIAYLLIDSAFMRAAIIMTIPLYLVLGCLYALYFCAKCERIESARLLHERGVRPLICLKCLYDLHGLTARQCPECGEALAPADAADQHRNT